MLTTLGLDIYDAAVREIALTLLGHGDIALAYESQTLVADKTFQFTNIRGSAPCAGIMYYNKCMFPTYTLSGSVRIDTSFRQGPSANRCMRILLWTKRSDVG